MAVGPDETRREDVSRGREPVPGTDSVRQQIGETERRGVSGERKSRHVQKFYIALMVLVVLILLGAIAYIALSRKGGVPSSEPQPSSQSRVIERTTYSHA